MVKGKDNVVLQAVGLTQPFWTKPLGISLRAILCDLCALEGA